MLALGLLVLMAVASCESVTEPGQAVIVTTTAPQTAASATHTPPRNNVAALGTGRAFEQRQAAHLAIDGDLDSVWNSQQFAPEWFSITFDEFYLVDRIEMVVTQLPAGPTTHEVWLGTGSGTRVLYKRLIDVHTQDGQTLEIDISPPRRLKEVFILTLDSPSWVAWREVRVFGALSADPPVAQAEANLDTVPPQAESAVPENAAPGGENISGLGLGFASAQEASAHLAIDGDPDSIWSSRLHPPQWYSISLDDQYIVDKVEMVVAQTHAGATTHELWLGNGSGTRTLFKRFTSLHTDDGQTLEVAVDPPRSISEVLIHTLEGPSSVAWREVRVFGSLLPDPIEDGGELRMNLKKVAAGLKLPVQVTHAGDGSGRLFVVEQDGRIRIVQGRRCRRCAISGHLGASYLLH